MPNNIPLIIIIMLCIFNPNFQFKRLEIKYISKIYPPPIKAPFSKPFFFMEILPIELPIKILIHVTIITTGVIVFSLTFVYVRITENINSKITVIKKDIPIALIIFYPADITSTSFLFLNLYI